MAKSGQEKFITPAANGAVFKVPATALPPENVGEGIINSRATVQLETTFKECPDNIAISNKFKCSIYRIDANSQIQGSSTKSRHTMGWGEIQALDNQFN